MKQLFLVSTIDSSVSQLNPGMTNGIPLYALMTGRVRLEYGPKDGFARHGRQTVHFGLGSAR
ncbi:MAG: hypothetical protein ACU0DI_08275 [Paracoccaceae bacterium]